LENLVSELRKEKKQLIKEIAQNESLINYGISEIAEEELFKMNQAMQNQVNVINEILSQYVIFSKYEKQYCEVLNARVKRIEKL
jgi:hypothetical protein